MTPTAPALETRSLSVAPAPECECAIRDLDLAIRPGETVALLGPNGVGKTTLIRTLAGILAPRSGSVILEGRAMGSWSARERAARVAAVFQNETPYFDFTAKDIVLQGRFHRQGALGRESASDVGIAERSLRHMGLEALMDRPTTRLSGGEWRRVLLARALAQSAPILLLDEPTAGLDIGWSLRALHALCAPAPSPRMVIMALHDPNLAATFCSRILLFGERRLQADGDPASTLNPQALNAAYGFLPKIAPNPFTGQPHTFPYKPDEGTLGL